MHLGPIQTDGPHFQSARLLGQQEHLHEQVLQVGQERARDPWPAYRDRDADCLR